METRNPPSAGNRTRLKVAAVATPLVAVVAGAALWFPRVPNARQETPTNREATSFERLASSGSPAAAAEKQTLAQQGHPTAEGEQQARPTIDWVQTISRLPTAPQELIKAHKQALENACEAIPVGEQAFTDSFQPFSAPGAPQQSKAGQTTLSKRSPVFSVGLDMREADQQKLPALSGGQIMSYLYKNYISLQVRLQKIPASKALFLHHRPLACVTEFTASAKTEKPTEGMNESLNNYRSLGVFLPQGELPTTENLRTLVLLNKGQHEKPINGTKDAYEFVFLRLRDAVDSGKPSYQLSAFVTSENRTRLHYLRADGTPADVNDCSIKSMIRITKYTLGIYPSENETVGTEFNEHREYALADLTAYADSQGWEDGPWNHLNRLLDAIIDSKVPTAPPAVP